MTQNAKVVKIKDDKTYVIVKRTSACSGDCKSCSGCDTKPIMCEVINEKGARVGDDVVIFSDTKKTLYNAFKLYILPIILLFAALFLHEAKVFNLGVLLVVILVLIILWLFILKKAKAPLVTVLEVVHNEN